MVQVTTNYDFPFPEHTDSPDVATHMENLASAVDTQMKTNADADATALIPFEKCLVAVANTAAVTSPANNQMIYDLSDSIVKRWNGSTWLDVMPGEGNTNHHACELTSSGQTIATNTIAAVNWNTSVQGTPDVTVTTPSGGIANSLLTFVRGGLWQVGYSVFSGQPIAISQIIWCRMISSPGNAVVFGSGSRNCQGDGGPIRIAAGTSYLIQHAQQSGSTATVTGFFRANWVRA